MKVEKKRMPNGKLSPNYYVRAMVNGKRIRICTGKSNKREAENFAKAYVAKLKDCGTAREVTEKFRQALSGGEPITLGEAFDRFYKKPRRRPMGDRRETQARGAFADFVGFMEDNYPSARCVHQVLPHHAEEWVAHLRSAGRWVRETKYKKSGKRTETTQKITNRQLSNRTINVYHGTAQMVCEALMEDSGLAKNPFSGIPKLTNDSETREAFTPAELKSIGEKADDFVYPIFAVGISTGLREGDICTLKWDEVDLKTGWITRKMSKTKSEVRIPILPGLRALLVQWPKDGDYVLPAHAEMYKRNPSGISQRVRKFLGDCEITTQREIDGRDRKISIKDVHSLRHTFVWLAAEAGIPLPIVQSVVGHLTPKMTQLYANHATDKAKQEQLKAVPDHMNLLPSEEQENGLSAEDKLAAIQSLVKSNKSKLAERVRKILAS